MNQRWQLKPPPPPPPQKKKGKEKIGEFETITNISIDESKFENAHI